MPLDHSPDGVGGANGSYVGHDIGREGTRNLGANLVDRALELVFDVWPIYRFYLADAFA